MSKWCVAIIAFLLTAQAGAENGRTLLDSWLEQQAKISTWSASVQQVRKLKSLKRALTSSGKIWFVAPNQFRWQLGEPVRTLAIRNQEQLLIVYPRLKQAERYPFAGVSDPAMQQALMLLEVGFPNDPERFYAQYEYLDAQTSDSMHRFVLQPHDQKARQLIERLQLEVSSENGQLLATELSFPDGSLMRNEFSEHRINSEIDPSLLREDLAGYQVVEPLSSE